MLTAKSIGRSLENITLGNSWLIPISEEREYHEIKNDLLFSLKYNTNWEKITHNSQAINEVKLWRDEVSTWEDILINDDVAMYPMCLSKLKSMYLCQQDKQYCEAVNQLSYEAVHNKYNPQMFHKRLMDYYAEYGVFRFRAVIGNKLFKQLRKHLQITELEFQEIYGFALHNNPNACDELLIEMLVEGRLTGAIRSYKIEREFYE